VPVQRPRDRALAAERDAERHPRREAEVVDGRQVVRIGERDREPALGAGAARRDPE
jgi:hypothetical protein